MSEYFLGPTGRRASYLAATTAAQEGENPNGLLDLATFPPTNGIVQTFPEPTDSMRRPRRDAAFDLGQMITAHNAERAARAARLGPRQGAVVDLNAGGLLNVLAWQMNPEDPFARSIHTAPSFHSSVAEEWSSQTSRQASVFSDAQNSFVAPKNLTELGELADQMLEHNPKDQGMVKKMISQYRGDVDLEVATNPAITATQMDRLCNKYIGSNDCNDPIKQRLICAALVANPTADKDIEGEILDLLFPQNDQGCIPKKATLTPREEALENFIMTLFHEQSGRHSSDY